MTFRLHNDVSKEKSLELVIGLLDELKKMARNAYANSPPELVMSQPFDVIRVMLKGIECKIEMRTKKLKVVNDEGKES